jgi:predicted DCC family thiol-disulfide oxidoreductase YuxK
MKKLTVLYDYNCGLCQRARRWLEVQPKFLALEFIPAGSDHARFRFPALPNTVDELVVVNEAGGVYRGDRAWIMCLYALAEYREWALRLATPKLLPLARSAFQLISENRIRISKLFHLYTDDGVAAELARHGVIACIAPPFAPRRTAPVSKVAPEASSSTGAPGSGGALHIRSTNEIREWLE